MLNEDYRFLKSMRTDGKDHVKQKLIPNITLQKLVKGNKEKTMKNYKRVFFLSVFSMSTEHMQLNKTESFTKLDSRIRNRRRWH